MQPYPDGLMLLCNETYYYVKGGRRYRLYSPRVASSWRLDPVVCHDKWLEAMPEAKSPLGFRDGTLIHNFADGRLYLISGNKRRQITNPDALKRFGWKRRDFVTVSNDEVMIHEPGEVIN